MKNVLKSMNYDVLYVGLLLVALNVNFKKIAIFQMYLSCAYVRNVVKKKALSIPINYHQTRNFPF